MTNGMSLDDVDRIGIDDAKALWVSHMSGAWGPMLHYNIAMVQASQMNQIKDITVMIHSKKHKPTNISFEDLFPEAYKHFTLGADLSAIVERKEFCSTMAELGGDVPKWILEGAKGDN